MDIWRVGVVQKRLRDIVVDGFGNAPVRWLEADRQFAFLADPFGLWRNERLYMFVEAYDYRSRHGHIEVLEFDRDLRLLDRGACLTEDWHLSYPFVFTADGETWMLPEAHRSGRLTLYRSLDFPHAWQAECVIDLPELPVDATPLFYQGYWWLFYSPADGARTDRLHVAYAKSLSGRWTLHPMNPLVEGLAASRPGGTPIVDGDHILLPVQDCTNGYGGGVRLLRMVRLTTSHVAVDIADPIPPPPSADPFSDGFHTLAAAGDLTLIDVKRLERSFRRLPIDALGRVRRAFRGWFPPSR